jgi:hypothetical protein
VTFGLPPISIGLHIFVSCNWRHAGGLKVVHPVRG